MSPYQDFGLYGEDLLAAKLRAYGYGVDYPANRLQNGADLYAVDYYGEVIPIAVKVARYWFRRQSGKWRYVAQFRFSNVTDDINLVAAGAQWAGVWQWFIIPGRVARERKSLFVLGSPLEYRGWAARYLLGEGYDGPISLA